MSLDVYQGTMMTGDSPAEWKTCIKEIEQMLLLHAGCNIADIVTDAGNDYSVVMYAGGGHYFAMSTTESNGAATVALSSGYMSQNGYVPLTSPSSYTSRQANRTQPILWVINGGEVWIVEFEMDSTTSSSGNYLKRYMIRGAVLKSSLTQQEFTLIGVKTNADPFTDPGTRFPGVDKLIVNNVQYAVSCSTAGYAKRGMPDNKVLLFPTLLSVAYNCNLGVPTINGKITYLMGLDTQLNNHTEFYVGQEKYVSLGSIAIRST